MTDKHAIERLEVAMATLQAEIDGIRDGFDVDQLNESNRAQFERLAALDVQSHFEIVRAVYSEDWPAEVIELWRMFDRAD